MPSATSETHNIKIYIAGDASVAEAVCRRFCFDVGACVTVTKTQYVYTGGQEAGVIVGFINYPKFPLGTDELYSKAKDLAERLRETLYQHSYTIESSLLGTEWVSSRE